MNIGEETSKKLTHVGIDSAEKLIAIGAEQTFLKRKEKYPQVCLVHLHALKGALEHVEFNSFSKAKKKKLKIWNDHY